MKTLISVKAKIENLFEMSYPSQAPYPSVKALCFDRGVDISELVRSIGPVKLDTKVAAIRLVIRETGASLPSAKAFVESLEV